MAKILVVEDCHEQLAAMSHVLREAGYEVTATTSGADAVAVLAAKPPPDLVLLDLLLPGGVTGYDILNRLGPSAPPMIVMSGADVKQEMLRWDKVCRVMEKPFGMIALLKAVHGCLTGEVADTAEVADPNCPPVTETLIAAQTVTSGGSALAPADRAKAVERYVRNNHGT